VDDLKTHTGKNNYTHPALHILRPCGSPSAAQFLQPAQTAINGEWMKSSTTVSEVIYAFDRRHPAHDASVLARVDALARYLNWGKYNPTGEGKRAKQCWADAYGRFVRMQKDPGWWQMSCPRQFAIANPDGIIPNYKEPEPFGSPLPKHDIDLEKIRAELKSRLDTASLCEEDVALIRKALVVEPPLKSLAYINLVCLWMKLYNDHKKLEKIARGNLKGHGWEYSSADEFNPSDAELSCSYQLDEKTIGAFRRGLYVLLRKRKGAPSKGNPWHSFRTIGILPDEASLVLNAA
jgi:hypothetical protein